MIIEINKERARKIMSYFEGLYIIIIGSIGFILINIFFFKFEGIEELGLMILCFFVGYFIGMSIILDVFDIKIKELREISK